ncbi:hypothetical protein OSTOST_20987 [Ostertagia ostertagi]
MIIIIAALILTTLAAPSSEVTSKSKCEYFLQKIPGMNPLVLTDSNGKKCRGVVEIPVCRGYCKTSESGTYMISSYGYRHPLSLLSTRYRGWRCNFLMMSQN